MPKIPVVNAKKLIKVLKKNGFIHFRSKGSHQIYVNKEKKISVSVPVHKGRDLGRGITLAVLKDAEISLEKFLKDF
jgi:predicted RNA binding protein YcfA (HicA-like mRNA interferase family)